MESRIISIREMRARRDPDYFVRKVSPAAMADRIEARRALDRELEDRARRQEAARAAELRRADLETLLLKVALISGGVGWLAAVLGLQ